MKVYCSSQIFKQIHNKTIGSYGTDFYAYLQTISLIDCLSICALNSDCVLVSFQSKTCKLFKLIQIQYFIDSSENTLYKKKDNK